MDPPSIDPPPVPAATTITPPVPAATLPTPTPTAAQHHPPYAEMIKAAITELNERDGSSKRAIAKYIEAHYAGLPPTHASLLTTHLQRLKTNGQLQMVKHSYALPRSAPAAIVPLVSTNGAVSSDTPRRRPGRPPKLKPADAVQPAVPVFPAPAPAPVNLTNDSSVPPANPGAPPQATFIAAPAGPVNGPAVHPRGRGRPPLKRGRGRPPKNSVAAGPTAVVAASGGGGRGRGRPRKNVAPAGGVGVGAAPQAAAAAAPASVVKGPGRPRGRPPKPINVAPVAVPGQPAAAAPVVVGVKRRGRPPKAGDGASASAMQQQQPKKPRKLSGKPVGRPRKDATANVNPTPDSQLVVAYLDMKAKLDNLHSRIQQTVTIVKPCLDNEAAINALHELEMVAATGVSAPASAQSEQPLPQPQPEQPPAQQPQVQS